MGSLTSMINHIMLLQLQISLLLLCSLQCCLALIAVSQYGTKEWMLQPHQSVPRALLPMPCSSAYAVCWQHGGVRHRRRRSIWLTITHTDCRTASG